MFLYNFDFFYLTMRSVRKHTWSHKLKKPPADLKVGGWRECKKPVIVKKFVQCKSKYFKLCPNFIIITRIFRKFT